MFSKILDTLKELGRLMNRLLTRLAVTPLDRKLEAKKKIEADMEEVKKTGRPTDDWNGR